METMEITAGDATAEHIEVRGEQAFDQDDCAWLAELPLSALLYQVLVTRRRAGNGGR